MSKGEEGRARNDRDEGHPVQERKASKRLKRKIQDTETHDETAGGWGGVSSGSERKRARQDAVKSNTADKSHL